MREEERRWPATLHSWVRERTAVSGGREKRKRTRQGSKGHSRVRSVWPKYKLPDFKTRHEARKPGWEHIMQGLMAEEVRVAQPCVIL